MELVTTPEDLNSLIQDIEKSLEQSDNKFIAIDTEFARERTYYPALGLVQIGYDGKFSCVDPLGEGMNLTPLKALLADEKIVKVFHACMQDVEIFYNIFDE